MGRPRKIAKSKINSSKEQANQGRIKFTDRFEFSTVDNNVSKCVNGYDWK